MADRRPQIQSEALQKFEDSDSSIDMSQTVYQPNLDIREISSQHIILDLSSSSSDSKISQNEILDSNQDGISQLIREIDEKMKRQISEKAPNVNQIEMEISKAPAIEKQEPIIKESWWKYYETQANLIKEILSPEQRQMVEQQMLKLLRVWAELNIVISLLFLATIYSHREHLELNPYLLCVITILQLGILGSIIYARIKDIKALYITTLLMQIKIILQIFLESEEEDSHMSFLIITMSLHMNNVMINHTFSHENSVMINLITMILYSVGVVLRYYDFSNIDREEIFPIIINSLVPLIMLPIFLFLNHKLNNLNLDICIQANKSQMEMKVVQRQQNETKQMFDSLQEGIVVIQQSQIVFKNSIFNQLFPKDEQQLEQKIFKVFNKNEDQVNISSSQSSNNITSDNRQVLSLQQLIKIRQNVLNDQIFEISEKQGNYKFVVLKVNEIHEEQNSNQKLLIQIIDMSDKILYNQVKAEKSFLTLINAAISHELRNPLNSLIGQINSMQSYFLSFAQILHHMKKSKQEQVIQRDIVDKLVKIYDGIQNCGQKMFSATKFIDFFVHDILDYSILNKEEKNFSKNFGVFDIREAIQEIIDILQDKIGMKCIQINQHYKRFNNFYIVKSDIKRLQQVLLNLVSNAIKFTDRQGKISIIVEHFENSQLRISVVDNGIGIKTKNQDKLFKLFGSIKDNKINTNGIGLGLVISKLIVNKFNGYIDFVSKYKKGSTFFYTFETQKHQQSEVNNAPQTKLTTDLTKLKILGSPKDLVELKLGTLNEVLLCYNKYLEFRHNRILVVDDEEFCISSMRAVLFSLGINVDYQVDFCITGKEALNQMIKTYENGMKYSIILTDFNMPVMNGIEATTKMRNYFAMRNITDQPKIIGITGHVLQSFKEEGLRSGMDEIYGKPVYNDTMKQILSKYYINQ